MTSGNDATVPVRMFYSKQITMMGATPRKQAATSQAYEFYKR
jgi:hypothetical protein